MFNKEFYDEVKTGIKEINKLKSVDERLKATIEHKARIYSQINDELDELFASVNLKKGKNED